MDDWVFGTVLRHAQISKAVVMFVCDGAAPDWWWGMWLDDAFAGRIVRFSGRRSEPRMWVRR